MGLLGALKFGREVGEKRDLPPGTGGTGWKPLSIKGPQIFLKKTGRLF